MSTDEVQQQLNSLQEFINLIQDKQLEHSLKLSKQTSVSVDGKTYKKKSLSAKQWRDISVLNSQLASASDEVTRLDKLIEVRTKAAEYYFGIPPQIFDANYEKLSPLIEGCILRSNSGLSPDIDLDSLLHEYQKQQQNKQ